MDKKLNVAVIGCGGISEVHLRSYASDPRVNLVALCDINPVNLARRGDEYHVDPSRRFLDEKEMLDSCPEIEAVSVCVWNANHAPCTIMALNAGKHVLCEKPMALNAREAQEMMDAAEKNHRLLMIGFVRRFCLDTEILIDSIRKGDFGDVYYITANYLRRKGFPGGWFGEKARSGGGPLIDLGVHIIDLARYLMGCPMPVSVYGATFNKLGARQDIKNAAGYTSASATDHDIFDVEDLATAMIRFDNGAVLRIETSFSLNGKPENALRVYGSKSGALIADKFEIYSDYNGYLSNVTFDGYEHMNDDMFGKEVHHYVDCVLNGTECRNPARDGVTLMKILDAVYESARTGHEVIL